MSIQVTAVQRPELASGSPWHGLPTRLPSFPRVQGTCPQCSYNISMLLFTAFSKQLSWFCVCVLFLFYTQSMWTQISMRPQSKHSFGSVFFCSTLFLWDLSLVACIAMVCSFPWARSHSLVGTDQHVGDTQITPCTQCPSLSTYFGLWRELTVSHCLSVPERIWMACVSLLSSKGKNPCKPSRMILNDPFPPGALEMTLKAIGGRWRSHTIQENCSWVTAGMRAAQEGTLLKETLHWANKEGYLHLWNFGHVSFMEGVHF